VLKRLESNETVVLAAEGLGADERERYVRYGRRLQAPAPPDHARHQPLRAFRKSDRTALNDLRSRLDAGELGAEGFQTALRLGGESLTEDQADRLSAPPRDD
jgi:hypothetical protein